MKIGLASLAVGAAFAGITMAISEAQHDNLSDASKMIILETAKYLTSNAVASLVTVGTTTAALFYATVKPLSYCGKAEKKPRDERTNLI